MDSVSRNCCMDCEWSASVEDHSKHELARLVVEHVTEFDHDIESDTERRI